MEATIFDIHRLSAHDGPGMRTVFFFKGCSLRCKWCQNPESIPLNQEIWYYRQNCIGCGQCIDVCPEGALKMDIKTGIKINKSACTGCGLCTEICPGKALKKIGQIYTSDDIERIMEKEKPFMVKSGGGITVSGGEPLMQADFVASLFKKSISEKISTALDTCGQIPWSSFEKVLPYTDLVLFDIKHIDSSIHKKLTGSGNELILRNLFKLAEYSEHLENNTLLWIRTPLIPGATFTKENIQGIAYFLKEHFQDKFERWELLSFNPLPIEKYERLGLDWEYCNTPLMTENENAMALSWAHEIFPDYKRIVNTGLTSKE